MNSAVQMLTLVYTRLVLYQPARAMLANRLRINFFISAGTRVELLPTLLRPADFDEARTSMDACQSSASEVSAELAAPSCVESLGKLNTQCTVSKRSAEAIGERSPQTMAELLFVARPHVEEGASHHQPVIAYFVLIMCLGVRSGMH